MFRAHLVVLLVLVSLLPLLLFGIDAQACPLGKGEEHLTVQRVMRNLGRFMLTADSAALKGMNPHDKVTDTTLTKSIEDLNLVLSCTQAAIQSPKGPLLPNCTQALTAEAFTNYVTSYVRLMKDFEIEVLEYQKMFRALLALPESQRNYSAVYQQSQKIENLVNSAHKELFGN